MKKQILLVAYEKDVLNSFPVTLTLVGHQVTLAHSGLDAIKQARNQSPELVVVDATLPDMDGATVAEILHRLPSTNNIPTLLLKPRPHPLMPASIRASGASSGLIEELNPSEFLQQVDDALMLYQAAEAEAALAEEVY